MARVIGPNSAPDDSSPMHACSRLALVLFELGFADACASCVGPL